MKLLFDENLSPRLVDFLAAEYPGSTHVLRADLGGAEDVRVWAYARNEALAIVSKDNDFRQRSFLEGAPPKVVWLEVGNAGTTAIAELLRREQPRMLTFERDEESALLVLPMSYRAV